MKLSNTKIFVIVFFILVFVLGYVSPVLADYLGPDRTVTVTTTKCEVVLLSCQWVEAKGIWKYKQSNTWSCANESKPWQQYSSSSKPCNSSNNGYDYWERDYTDSTSTVTYPPAEISGTLQGCTLYNGWCNTNPTLALSASEPVAGYSITNIEGIRNGAVFTCPAGTNCSQSLVQGANNFTYWAHSTLGDTSTASSLSANVDTVAPTVNSLITGTAGLNGWYVSNVTVSASGTDATSGLASAQVSVNGGAWQASAPLTNGTFTVTSRTTDNAGNIATLSKTINVDTIAPSVTPVVPMADGSNGWVRSGPPVVSAEGADSGSGLASAQVSVDNGAWQSSATLPDGVHAVQFKSVDVAGNSTTVSRTIKVDINAPSVFASTVGTSGNGGWYISQATTTLTSNDSASGIDRLEYSYNNGDWQTGTSISSVDGVNTIDVRVYDLAGNVTTNSFTVKVDTVAPTLNAVFPTPDGLNGWVVTAPAAVSAEGEDSGSGLASAQVSVDNGPWQSGLSLPDGLHTVKFKSLDNAGNSSTVTHAFKVDTTAPSLSFTSDGTPGNEGWYVSQVTTNILSGDEISGIGSVQYNPNSTGWKDGSSFSSNDGVNHIDVRISDAAGNVSADTLQIRVDTIAPSISPAILGTQGTFGWYISKTTTSFLPEDKTSGIEHVEYSQNGASWQRGDSVESQDGINSISVKVYDHAGNVSVDTLQVKVDTGKPSSTFISPVNGSENNLARAIFPMSGTSTDALSGVSRAELSVDEGRTWNSLILSDGKWTYDLNTIDLADGVYKVVVRTTDLAGNTDTLETSTAFVSLLVSNGRPQIKLTPEWFVWQSGSLSIHSEYFPLKGGMVTISDPQRRWPKVEIPFDENYPKSITWDRRFANGILATSGDYDVAVTACNTYNRCSSKKAIIKIPWIAVIIPVPSPTTPVVVTPEKPVVEEIPERSSIPPVVPLETSPAPQIKQHNTSGRIPPAPVQIALALVTLIALLWAVASASLSDRRPVAINAIAKTISEAR